MTTFDNREKAFEAKFSHDNDLRFKAEMKRNKLVGQWAADQLGLSGAEAEDYIKTVIRADFEEAGDQDVFRKIRADFDDRGVSQSDEDIRAALDKAMDGAMAELG